MATPEPVRRTTQTARSAQSARTDLEMSNDDWHELRMAVAKAFFKEVAADNILGRIRFPREQHPGWSGNSEEVWGQIFVSLENGIIEFPQRQLLDAARRVYPYNPTFRTLALRYGLILPDTSVNDDGVPQPTQPRVTTPDGEPAEAGRRAM